MTRGLPAQVRQLAAVAIPDERYDPPSPAHVIIVTVITDGRRVWHVYPDGAHVELTLPRVVSTPRETVAKPRLKPRRHRRQGKVSKQ